MTGRVEGGRHFGDWNEIFNQLSNGHEHIYANEFGEVRVFASTDAAKASHFSHRLSLSKIIDIMITKLKGCSNDQELEAINRNLRLLIEKKQFKMGHPSVKERVLREIYKSRLNKQEIKIQKAKERALPHLNIISEDVARAFLDNLGHASMLIRSLNGKDGVYYVRLPNDDTTFLLKSMPDPLSSVIADRFYHQFGFQVPHYSPVFYGSVLGREIQTTMDQRKLSIKDPTQEVFNQDVSLASFMEGVEKNNYITVLKMIKGTPFNQLSVDDAIAALKDERILKAIGKMIFLDAVIDNGDRFCMQINLGNILLLPENERSREGEMPIALIDHAYKNTDPENAEKLRKNLLSYQEGKLLQEQVFFFVKSLIKSLANDDANKLSTNIYPYIREGFDEAQRELVQKFSDRSEIDNLFDIEGVSSESKPDPSLLMNVLGTEPI